MKKLLLVLASGAFVLATNAQERVLTVDYTPQETPIDFMSIKQSLRKNTSSSENMLKTTAAPRWYSFVHYFDTSEFEVGSSIAFNSPYLWKDSMGVMAYSDGSGGTVWQHNTMVSLSLSIDPSFSGFNSPYYYNGAMEITPTDPYIVDSIRFFGRYGFNPANTYVDTLRVAFVYGDGGSTSDIQEISTTNPAVLTRYGVTGSMAYYRMGFDTVTVTASGTTRIIKDILLDNTGASPAWGDTSSNGVYMGSVGFSDVSVPAGNMIGASVTFISGSPTFTPHDTVFGSSIGYKHNMFRPFVAFKGTSSSPLWNTYDATNKNTGSFKTLPDTAHGWGGVYTPQWFWSAGSGSTASMLQYPYIDFHIKCSTCGVVDLGVDEAITSGITQSAYPNPAFNEVNIPFTLSNNADVTVAMYNLVGQKIGTQSFINVNSGKAVFKTDQLAPGMYVYTIESDGVKQTGRVAISH